jgi:para-nitrobenzyl esterase
VPDEDCLVLNVWRPSSAEPGGALPVLVWIHGGGYVNGGSSAAVYDGTHFARQGLVVVSLNYRLGRFGFFAHPALIAAAEDPVGNYGYLDQLAALRWIQRNIAAFGGNPGAVTIAGESAGGASVLDLVASHPKSGLFHRAVVMSGGGRDHLLGGRLLTGGKPLDPTADRIGVNYAKSVRVDGEDAQALTALRRLPGKDVVGDLNMTGLFLRTILPIGRLKYAEGPIIDGSVVRGAPGDILRAGGSARVPLIIGTTGSDLSTWYPSSKDKLFEYFGDDAARARAVYDPRGSVKKDDLVSVVGADRTMHEPARFVARAMTSAGNRAWLYRFSYVAESERAKVKGAGHASELPFLFDTLDARYGADATARDRATARAFHLYVAHFARSGDPNGDGLPRWSHVDETDDPLLDFTLANGPVLKRDPLRDRLDLIERAAEQSRASRR